MSGRSILIRACALLVCLRLISEMAMIQEHGSDAQMAIWEFLLIVKTVMWSIGAAVPLLLMSASWMRRWFVYSCGLVLVLWSVFIVKASAEYNTARRALADASSVTTSPSRLSDLATFDGIRAGYELDNRLASNPSTPPEALRMLSQRTDQTGTIMCLIKNANTPKDVLEKIHVPRP